MTLFGKSSDTVDCVLVEVRDLMLQDGLRSVELDTLSSNLVKNKVDMLPHGACRKDKTQSAMKRMILVI